eukprot:gene2559-2721_t
MGSSNFSRIMLFLVFGVLLRVTDSFLPSKGYLSRKFPTRNTDVIKSSPLSPNLPLMNPVLLPSIHPGSTKLLSSTLDSDSGESKGLFGTVKSSLVKIFELLRLYIGKFFSALLNPFIGRRDGNNENSNDQPVDQNEGNIREEKEIERFEKKPLKILSFPSISIPTPRKYKLENTTSYVQNQLKPIIEPPKVVSNTSDASASSTAATSPSFARAAVSAIDEKIIAGRKYVENRLKEIQETNQKRNQQQQETATPVATSAEPAVIPVPPMNAIVPAITEKKSEPAPPSTMKSSITFSPSIKKRQVFKTVESIKVADLQNKKALINLRFDQANPSSPLNERQVKTIRYLLKNNVQVFLLPSYGNPTENEKYILDLSTSKFIQPLQKLFSDENVGDIAFIPDVIGTSLASVLHQKGKTSSLFLFENVLFYSQKINENDQKFGNFIGKSFDVYVNDDADLVALSHKTALNNAIAQSVETKVIGYALNSKLNEAVRGGELKDNEWVGKYAGLAVVDSYIFDK